MSAKQQLIETLASGNAILNDIARGIAVGLLEQDEIKQRLDGLQAQRDHTSEL